MYIYHDFLSVGDPENMVPDELLFQGKDGIVQIFTADRQKQMIANVSRNTAELRFISRDKMVEYLGKHEEGMVVQQFNIIFGFGEDLFQLEFFHNHTRYIFLSGIVLDLILLPIISGADFLCIFLIKKSINLLIHRSVFLPSSRMKLEFDEYSRTPLRRTPLGLPLK